MVHAHLADLLPIARDLSTSLSSESRATGLLEAVRRALPCDAAALLRVDGDALVPIATFGLSPDAAGRRFERRDHPRLDAICASLTPTLFPANSELPDPYDGLVADEPLTGRVHSCLGCPLYVEGRLVGVLTADALAPGAFDGVSREFLEHLAALAGAALRTNDLIEALERRAERSGQLTRDFVRDALIERGAALIGSSPTMVRLRREIELVARTHVPVLVTGETGVGKELVVRQLHAFSPRAEAPLVHVNCAALPDSIVESELFGHVRGAFTGAVGERSGRFGAADGASLFLDEIGELPPHVQPKLLRVLQEGEVQRVGADRAVRVDVRVFAATNRDLEAEVRAGRFRADLFHRLDVCRVRVPALREHASDIPQLAGHFADRARSRLGTGPIRFTIAALEALSRGDWPGNARELDNVVQRAILRAAGRGEPGATVSVATGDLDVRAVAHAAAHGAVNTRPNTTASARTATDAQHENDERVASDQASTASPHSLRASVDDFKRAAIRAALARTDGNWAAAARELGLHRANLHHLARRLGLAPNAS
jgi:anaerobic nitric oxide reductase transcription regulator